MTERTVSKSALQRLPVYLNFLKSLPKDSPENISATAIADALKLNDVLVRKDIALVSSSGKPKVGYNARELIGQLESFLGYKSVNTAIIVGAGKLGRALMGYGGFKEYGLNILAAFESREEALSERENILHISALPGFCAKTKVKIGIITVPAAEAQRVCDLLVKSGLLAIWNFAPAHLTVPDGVILHNENMAASLAMLSAHLTDRIEK